MKLILDQCLSPNWVPLLRSYDVAAEHWSTLGSGDAPDPEIIAYARRLDYAIFTVDLDFGKHLQETTALRPSVIQLRTSDPNYRVIGAEVALAIKSKEAEIDLGALVTIDAPPRLRVRVTMLPIFKQLTILG